MCCYWLLKTGKCAFENDAWIGYKLFMNCSACFIVKSIQPHNAQCYDNVTILIFKEKKLLSFPSAFSQIVWGTTAVVACALLCSLSVYSKVIGCSKWFRDWFSMKLFWRLKEGGNHCEAGKAERLWAKVAFLVVRGCRHVTLADFLKAAQPQSSQILKGKENSPDWFAITFGNAVTPQP